MAQHQELVSGICQQHPLGPRGMAQLGLALRSRVSAVGGVHGNVLGTRVMEACQVNRVESL